LACLFSPKVYIILLHPEKNMRLTKQLKAQANSLKFASQLATKSNFILNNQILNHDLSNNDGQSKSILSNDNEDNLQPSISNSTIKMKSIANNCENNDKTINNNKTKPKIPIIITTSQSDNCFYNTKHELNIKKYNYGDNDSLNSNSLEDEDIMV